MAILRGSSKQYIGVVDMICEGPIHGLIEGKSSVYLDNIPFETSSAVGSFTQETVSASPTLTPTSATQVDVTGVTLTSADVGKYVIIEVARVDLTSVTKTVLPESGGAAATYSCTAASSFSSSWETHGDNKKFVALENAQGRRIEANAHGSGTTTLTVIGMNVRQFNSSDSWDLVLCQAVEIATVVDSDTFTTSDNIENYASLSNAPFHIRDQVVVAPDNTNPDSTVGKVEGSTLQFRIGEQEQAPIQQVHGVSGGVTSTGSSAAVELLQWTGNLSTYTAGTGLNPDTFYYPEGQSRSENGGVQRTFNSNAFGASNPSQVDEINIRISYPSLITYNNEAGDKEDAHAIYVFEIQTSLTVGGSSQLTDYKRLFSEQGGYVVHKGKTTAPVAFDHTIGLERFKPFDDFNLRVTRLTRHAGLPVWADGTTGGRTDRDKWNLQATANIGGAGLSSTVKDKFIYPHTAIGAISFSSKTYSSLPVRSYLIQGLRVKIPNTYTPREYSSDGVAKYDGFWGGAFKDELYYTDNPAWVFYDIVTNNRYGAGRWLETTDINKYALYRIAKYCDELVPSGTTDSNGDDILEPRFRANIYLAKATDVYKVLKDMATVFTGILYWLDGSLTAVQDVPASPIYTFSKSNVLNGLFNYESSGRKTRSNQVVVTWNDPSINYEPTQLIVEDREDIVKTRKIISQNSVAMGATSEGQAIRYGRWKLWTAQNQKEIVSFQTGLQGAYIRPGDIINVQDRDRYAVDYSGLISSVNVDSPDQIVLDRQITTVADVDQYEFTTLVTEYAAFYTGLDPITLQDDLTAAGYTRSAGHSASKITYNRGDRIVTSLRKDNGSSIGVAFTVNSSRDAANAMYYDTTAQELKPLPVEWREESYVVTKVVSAPTTVSGKSVVSVDTSYVLPNRTSDNSGTVTQDDYTTTERPQPGTVWALRALDSGDVNILGSLKEYRVLGISHDDAKNTYGITAVEYYRSKYDAVDKDYALGYIPANTYPEIEDPDANVPSPSNIYVVLETDSSKPGEELRLEWDKPQETYFPDPSDTSTTDTRDYQFLDGYELHHNIPDLDSPIFTTKNVIRFDKLPNARYTFRVRTVSQKGNYSDYVSTFYEVDDPFGTNVPRIVGGLPKGIVANSTAYDVHNAEITDEEDRYKLIWERDSSAKGFSIANTMFGGTSGIAGNLQAVGLFGLAVSGPLAHTSSGGSTAKPDGVTGDTEWHYLHYDGGTNLLNWNTTSLDALPFYQKIDTGGFGWRGSAQTWSKLLGSGGDTTATVAAGSNRLVAATNGDFLSDLKLRDIVHFDGKAESFRMYKIKELAEVGGENVVSVEVRNADNNTETGSAYTLGWQNGDIVTFERVEGATAVNGQYYYVKTTGVSDRVQLYNDYALTSPVRTANLGGTYTDFTGFVTRAKVKAAKVTGIIDNNTAILDRSFEDAISVNEIYKAGYEPDYTDDAIFGRVKWNSYNTSDNIHTFTVDTFIDVNEGLNIGALDVLVRPGVGSILYSNNGTTQETQFTGALTVTLIASGFSNPQFRITKVEGAGATLDFDMDADSLTIPFVGNSGALDYTQDLFTQTEANSIPWTSGDPIEITAEVREANNTGVNTTGKGYIIKASSGADGIDGNTVELRAEDYSIIYDEAGASPTLNGNDRVITFTATARNYNDPQFKFTFNGANLANQNAFTLAGDPGYNVTTAGATYTWGTTKEVDVQDGIVATATVTVPETYNGNWGNNKNQKTFFVTVEAREGSSGPFTAVDEVTIIGVHALKGGYWVAMSNSSGNSIPTDFNGDVSGTADNNGFVTVADTGTTVEVGKGAEILALTDLSTSDWDAASASSKLGFYNISHVETPNAAINRGAQSGGDSSTDYIVTYADHKFSKTGWTQETAAIQYIIDVEDTGSANAIKITQPFTKSKQGFGGARLILSNPTQDVPADNSLIPHSLTSTGTTVNCFLTGLNLPYYASGATIPASVNAFWRLKSINPTNVTADSSPTYPSNGSTAAVTFGNITAFPKTASTGSIEFTAGLSIRGADGNFVEEDLEVTQTFRKRVGAAYVNLTATPSHYTYDQDSTTPSPTQNHTFTINGFIGEEAEWKYVLTGGALGNSSLTANAAGLGGIIKTGVNVPNTSNLNYYDANGDVNEYIYTVKLYNKDDTNNDTLLAEDSASITLSRSAPDNFILDLTNDYDAVVVPGIPDAVTGSARASALALSISTTANIYKNGVLNNTGWSFAASQSTTLRDGNTSTSTATLAFDSSNTNQLNITSLGSDYFVRSAITITATHNDHPTQQAIFVLQRLFGGSQLKIIPSVDVVTYDPVADTYDPSNATVTFAVNRISENGEAANVTDYYYELDGGTKTLASTTAPSKNFSSGAPNPVVADSTILKVFDSQGTNAIVKDSTTVPLILQGVQGVDGVAISLTAQPVSFDLDGDTYDPNSTSAISLTVNGATATGATWTDDVVDGIGSLSSYTGTGAKTFTFADNRSEAQAKASTTITVTVTGTTSDGTTNVNLGTASVKIPTTIGGTGPTGLYGLRQKTGYVYFQQATTTKPQVPTAQDYSFTQQAFVGLQGQWAETAPTFTAGATNQYWYASWNAAEARNADGAPAGDTTRDASGQQSEQGSLSFGQDTYNGVGFTGLVTFTDLQQQGSTQINGANITTGTINAARISLQSQYHQVGQLNNDAGYQTNAYYQSSQISALGFQTTALTSVNTQQVQGYQAPPSDINQLNDAQSLTLTEGQKTDIAQAVTDVSGLNTLLQTGQTVAVAYSQSYVGAGKIVLQTQGLILTTQAYQVQTQSTIILDTTGGNNRIQIYDTGAERVRLGKL